MTKLSELKPKPTIRIIHDEVIIFRNFSLEFLAYAEESKQSLNAYYEFIFSVEGINEFWDLCFRLQKNYRYRKDFEVFIFSGDSGTHEIAATFRNAIEELIHNSMPLIKNQERMKDLQKLNNGGEIKPPCYAEYFDTLASRYGYDLKKYFDLTLRQLHILLETINGKKYDELEVQAALLGKKLKPQLKPIMLSDEDEKENLDMGLKALERLKQEHLKRVQNGK